MFYPTANIDNSYSGSNTQSSSDVTKISNVQILCLAAVLHTQPQAKPVYPFGTEYTCC